MRRLLPALAALLCTLPVAAACGSSDAGTSQDGANRQASAADGSSYDAARIWAKADSSPPVRLTIINSAENGSLARTAFTMCTVAGDGRRTCDTLARDIPSGRQLVMAADAFAPATVSGVAFRATGRPDALVLTVDDGAGCRVEEGGRGTTYAVGGRTLLRCPARRVEFVRTPDTRVSVPSGFDGTVANLQMIVTRRAAD